MAQTLLSTRIRYQNLPENYIRPKSDRPQLSEVVTQEVPLIDLSSSNKDQTIREIGDACRTFGFFKVENHGIPQSVVDDMLSVAREFFKLPEADRLKCYSDDPSKSTRLSTSFNVKKEKVSNWRDYLRLHCYPVEDFVHEWPSNPPSFREIVSKYSGHGRRLALKLLEAISENLGMDRHHMEKSLGKQAQHMAINYYPPCPKPELTYGLPGHTDPNALTLLLQDQVSGLQVLRNGRWVAVHPIPNTFVVNIGDQIQVLSNGLYRSVLHRAVVNSNGERMSIPTFYCPSPEAVIEPAKQLINEQHPSLYRSFTYGEYYHKFWDQGLHNENCLDMFRATC